MTHELKCWPEFFAAVKSGRKTFEIRRNDRDYHRGDTLILREFTAETAMYTGRAITLEVTYCLREQPWVPEGYVCMAVRPVNEVSA